MRETASNSPTVLVVDDEPLIRRLIGYFLRSRRLFPIEACNGTEALQLIRTQKARPDLVIVDLIMPGRGGLSLLRELREEKADMAALIVAGCCPDPAALTASIDERTHFLAKPFNFKMLEVEINSLLSLGPHGGNRSLAGQANPLPPNRPQRRLPVEDTGENQRRHD